MNLHLTAIVSGLNCSEKPFTDTCRFELLPPKDSNHYGTGYYMSVRIPGSVDDYVDVRYEGTTDISELADRWIRNYFGKNVHKVVKEFPLTYNEFLDLALKNYTKGGDTYYECWDNRTFDFYVEEFGPITHSDALAMFQSSKSILEQY